MLLLASRLMPCTQEIFVVGILTASSTLTYLVQQADGVLTTVPVPFVVPESEQLRREKARIVQ